MKNNTLKDMVNYLDKYSSAGRVGSVKIDKEVAEELLKDYEEQYKPLNEEIDLESD